jgi:hypothetical protein
MPVSYVQRSRLGGQLEALENQFPGMPPGLMALVRSCAASIAGGQRVETFAIALKKGRLDRYRHRHHDHKWIPVIEAVEDAWDDFTRFNESQVMVKS